jgi:ankyrin repeat protein
MISINDRIKQIYLDLFQDDPVYVTLGLSLLQDDLLRINHSSSVLCFSDWAQLSEITTYDDNWIEEFQFDLMKRAFEFSLTNCAEVLFMIGEYRADTDRFLTLVNTAIESNSLESIDVLIGFLMHPEAELYLGGPNLLSQSFLKGRKIVVDHLLTKYNMNPDGLKTINAMGTYEDYSDVEFTIDLGSLGYIMTSPYLSYLEKIDMMSYAISKGASPLGHSPEADCFDPPIAIAASIHIVLLDYFISLGIATEYSGLELVYAAVSSKAPFIEKEKILDRLFEIYDIDVNQRSEEKGYSLIEYALIRNGKDALETLEYLINKGSDYDADNLIQIAHTSRQYELRDKLFYKLGGSTSLYNDLIDEEKELMRKEDESRLSGKPRIWVVFPEKEY